MQEEYTPQEAAKYLGIAINTFYKRLRELQVKPANYNPMRRRQRYAIYTRAQLDEMRAKLEEEGEAA